MAFIVLSNYKSTPRIRDRLKAYASKEDSTHRSAKTHGDTVFVTSDFDLLTPKKGYRALIVTHFCVKFGDPSCIDF